MIDINCDMGEGVNNEHLLMPYITSCNIACGGHAGDVQTMQSVVTLCKKYGVKIGAHPSYPDKENFGRESMQITAEKLSESIIQQIQALEKIVEDGDHNIHHIKPHGALYNDLVKNSSLANIFLDAIDSYKGKLTLYSPFGSIIATEALKKGFHVIYEAFADRNYNDDLSLVSRKNKNAVITESDQVIAHVSLMKSNGTVKTISGKEVHLKASTFCVHSDTDNAILIIQKLHDAFL